MPSSEISQGSPPFVLQPQPQTRTLIRTTGGGKKPKQTGKSIEFIHSHHFHVCTVKPLKWPTSEKEHRTVPAIHLRFVVVGLWAVPQARGGASSPLFKQSLVHCLPPPPQLALLTALSGRLAGTRDHSGIVVKQAVTLLRPMAECWCTCAVRLCRMVPALLHSGLQTLNLLVVVGPLGHDPHRRLQLGLFGHGVVALRSGRNSKEVSNALKIGNWTAEISQIWDLAHPCLPNSKLKCFQSVKVVRNHTASFSCDKNRKRWLQAATAATSQLTTERCRATDLPPHTNRKTQADADKRIWLVHSEQHKDKVCPIASRFSFPFQTPPMGSFPDRYMINQWD